MLLGLTGGDTVLVIVAGIFIVCALLASMVIPRYRPYFPGESMGWFTLGAGILFAGMLTAVVLAAGGEEGGHEGAVATETQPAETTAPATTGESTPATTAETTTTGTEPTETEPAPTTTGGEGGGDAAAGKAVFASAGCTGCHTLQAAGSTGNVGPNLDDAKPSADKVVERVTEGKGVMPSFKGQLSEQQIQDVAAFVSTSTRGE
jgi:mono/diheme cytochrome c family protein